MLRAAAVVLLLLGTAACSDDGPAADPKEFCRRLERLTENDPFQAFGPSATSAQIEEAFDALVAAADDLDEVAPAEAKGAAGDYADAAHELADLLADADYDGSKADTRAYRGAQVTYAQASARLLTYLDASC